MANNYQGRQSAVSEEQIGLLKTELRQHLYPTAEAACDYVNTTFHARYSAKGMVALLHRIGFSYKKATVVPGKIDADKQQRFVKTYRRRYKNLPDNEKVYFSDGCTPPTTAMRGMRG